ncbi:MAG: hypothetical protein C0601_07250 [Candidatus Muiribacterium halophilum]|uniref:Carbamoyl transferase n=1 Tax=Muiribacterium halophilum TaxID=2053465 RepID=A0A2N5ZFR0_MUIH1|nr:MAG: hypothetical protein C0601_07250 [Candidatus Muirbacterium halophilum]
MYIIGISCYYHDSSACIVSDDKIFAAQEERFDRRKKSDVFPENSIRFCLDSLNITIDEVDAVVFYEKPFLKFWRTLSSLISSWPFSYRRFHEIIPRYLGERLVFPSIMQEKTGYKGKVYFSIHHLSHAASAFLLSGFDQASIITCDGIGELDSLSIGIGKGKDIKIEKTIGHPDSLGLLYSAITTYCGFRANGGEGKVMALGDLGKPSYIDDMLEIISIQDDGSFRIDQRYFDFNSGNMMFTKRFEKRFGQMAKSKDTLESRHYDMAASLQLITEKIMINIVNKTYERHGNSNLCVAGGVFLNCVMNSRILKDTQIENMFVQPAAGDAGGALGAAVYLYNELNDRPFEYVMENAFLGPDYSDENIRGFLIKNNIKYVECTESEVIEKVSSLLQEGKIVGWFQGAMEFGPRALGHRSILADARVKDMKDILNSKVKHREWFRPYGVSIMEEKINDVFNSKNKNQFMLFTGNANEDFKNIAPSAVHIDGSSRYQGVNEKRDGKYYRLIKRFFEKTNVPFVINTSFNDNNEPIVCSPEDAYNCFKKTGLDVLVLGNNIIEEKY